MTTLDINSNYCDRGGGIRTYHQAKIDWFNRQDQGRYYLVIPGPRHSVRRVGRRVVRIEVYGLPLGSGYRLLLDYPRIARLLARLQPRLVEVGDPFFSGPVCLLLRRFGRIGSRIASFYHSDPIETWVVRWAQRGHLRGVKQVLAAVAGRLFYRLQRTYDVTIVTSQAMELHLTAQNVARLERFPLGVDRTFFSPLDATTGTSDEEQDLSSAQPPRRRLLFVGRLIADKAADLLWDALPRIAGLPGVEVTVLGSGPNQHQFAAARWPGYRYREYIAGRQELAEIYRQHDILLAPGPYETFGLAVLEAMASGLVVVGPDRGGTAELLAEARSPFVFRAGDLNDFVRAVTAAVSSDLEPYRRSSLAAAERYGPWDTAIGRLMAFYGACLAKAPADATRDSTDGQSQPGRIAA